MANLDDPRIGTTVLEKLRVDALLGAGGMGAVYRVHHLVTKHDRALKVLHPDLATDEEVIKRLTREAGVAGTLRSPHVVETLDVGRLDDDSPFVLMELLDGEALADRMERGMIPKKDLIGFICQACQGVAHAHAAGIVHRDLKPENLFIVRGPGGDERIKILDFGISKFQVEALDDGNITREGTVLGTPLYMSPEQSTGEAGIGPATDIYSLGVILYEGLSGRTPHEAANFPSLLVQLNTEPAKPLRALVPDIEPALANIVDQTLAIRPTERPPSAEALLRALAPFADPSRVQHLDALRNAPQPSPRSFAMADTMAGGLVDDLRGASERPLARPAAQVDEPATPVEPAAPAEEARELESSRGSGSNTGEIIAESPPRPSWKPWVIAAAAVVGLIAALALFYGPDEEAPATIGADEVPAAAEPPAPEPTVPEAPEPTTPEGIALDALEPAAQPPSPEPVAPDPPPSEPAPSARPDTSAPSSSPRYDLARENPYE